MPYAACGLQMGKFMSSSSQSSSRQDCRALLAKRGSSTPVPWQGGTGQDRTEHALQVTWQIVLIIQLISSLSPILIQTQARQSAASWSWHAGAGSFAPSPQPWGMRGTSSLAQTSAAPPVQETSLRVAVSADKPVPPEPQPVATCSKRSECSVCHLFTVHKEQQIFFTTAGRCTGIWLISVSWVWQQCTSY